MRKYSGWVVAVVVLVLTTAGTAVAAKHYVISSSKQIAPKVRKQLKGKTGKTGKAGVAGPIGAQGVPGPQGPQGGQGPIGPSAVYEFVHAAQINLTSSSEPIVDQVAPEPGDYLVQFRSQATLKGIAGQTQTMTCALGVASTPDPLDNAVLAVSGGNSYSVGPITMSATATLAADEHVVITCARDNASGALRDTNLTLLKVARRQRTTF